MGREMSVSTGGEGDECSYASLIHLSSCVWGGAHHYLMLRDLVMRGYELESRLVVAEVHQPALH